MSASKPEISQFAKCVVVSSVHELTSNTDELTSNTDELTSNTDELTSNTDELTSSFVSTFSFYGSFGTYQIKLV